MSAHAPVDLRDADPWADPSPGQSGFWMATLALFVIFSIFALTYLAWEYQDWGEAVSVKAPSAASPTARLKAAQREELTRTVRGDKVVLRNGRVIDAGLAVEGTDPSNGSPIVTICGPHYLATGDADATVVQREGKGLRFPKSQVARIEKGTGKTLAVPIHEGLRRYLRAYREQHGR